MLTDFGCRVPEEELQLVNALVRCLRLGKYLLVIDNLESLLKTDGQWKSQFYEEFFRAWIESGKESKILVTTREKPDLREFEWLHLKGLKKEEGASLLKDLGIKGEVEAFAELVDGHPLLLKIVADLIKDEYPQDPSLERLAELGLGNLQELLTDPKVVGQHRRENVGMVLVLDASFERLADWQKIWLENVSVYRGAFDGEAAIAMLPQPDKSYPLPVERGEVEQELRKLVKRSLLEEKLNHKRQFAFQAVVLEYVRYKAGDQAEAHQRAIAYYRSIVKEPPWQTIDDLKEYLEIFYHLCQLGEYAEANNILSYCNKFLDLRGYYSTIVELNQQLIQVWQPRDDEEKEDFSWALTRLGNAYNSLGQFQKAIQYHQLSLNIDRELGNRSGEGGSLCNLGNAYLRLGQYQQAIEYFQQALVILQKIGHCYFQANSLGNLGSAYLSLGQYQRAIEFYQQSLEIARSIGDRSGEASSLGNLGSVYGSLGQYQRAIEFYQQSLEIERSIGDRSGEASSLGNLGSAYESLGQFQKAIELQQQALELRKQVGDRVGEGGSLCNLGHAYASLSQYQQAIEFYQQALVVLREANHPQFIAKTLTGMGSTYKALDQHQQAIDFYEQALELRQKIGDRSGEASSLIGLGLAYYSLGQYQRAIEFYQQSLEIIREIGDRLGEAIAWFNLGLALENVNRKSDAIDAYRNARQLYEAMGLDADVQNCDQAIERLSQGFWGWLSRLFR